MYFASRLQAGRMLAEKLKPQYRYENCAVLALSDGGAMVGAQIATELHCVLTLLLSSEIKLPREPEAVAGITAAGTVTYNSHYSDGQIDDLVSEYRGHIEQEKLTQLHEMNQLIGSGGTVRRDLLRYHNVILVSDGMKSGFQIDLALQFLKPIAIEKLIIATPLASVKAVDKMHIMADDLYVLNVIEDFHREIDHYYEKQDIPSHDTVVKTIEQIVLNWK